MGYTSRFFISGQFYAITFRTLETLPFIASLYMKLLIGGVLARAQRDLKVTLSHFIWMGNHPHILAVFKDPDMAKKFYGEVEKKLTDSIKALLGLPHLHLWEGRPVVAHIIDIDSAIKQIAYLYANPSRAHLVDSISSYPGYSSWSAYQQALSSPHLSSLGTDSIISSKELWVPFSKTPLLPSRALSPRQDLFFTHKLQALGIPHTLEIHPNAWMKCFGVTSLNDVQRLNQRVLSRIEELESSHRKEREEKKITVVGVRRLQQQPIFLPHIPKDRATRRRVYVISSCKELRIAYINRVKALCELVRGYYQDLLKGISRVWPPGMFKPPLRPLASALV